MRKAVILLLILLYLPHPKAYTMEFTAPTVGQAGQSWMPEETGSFDHGLRELILRVVDGLRPDLREAAGIGVALTSAVLLMAVVQTAASGTKGLLDLCTTAMIVSILLGGTRSMVMLGEQTVEEVSQYGSLLLPVMASALAAQGGVTASAGLYAGTAIFNSLLMKAMEAVILPGIWLYLALAAANGATGENLLKKTADLTKSFLSWMLKLLLMVFTTYLSITGVVSGSTDAAALKAAKVSISTFVPVVGGVLSDASEAVLVSAGLMKNAAGIYGILAVLAIFLHPFLKICIHYLILKGTAAVCAMFGSASASDLIDRFGSAMGLLLGMTAAGCVMVLVSTVCFLRGVG